MLEGQIDPVDRLPRHIRLFMPDWLQDSFQHVLVEVFDGSISDLGDHMYGEGRHPAASVAVSFELSLSGSEAAFDGFFDGETVRSVPKLGAGLYRVIAITKLLAGGTGSFTRLSDGDIGPAPQAHLSTLAVDHEPYDPLALVFG